MTSASPVSHYLTEISGDAVRQLGDPARMGGRNAGGDVESRIEEARLRGAAEARAAAEAAQESALAAQRAAFEVKLAAERQRWTSEEGERLAALVSSRLLDIEQKISERVGRVLRPVVDAEVRRAAVSSLAETLRSMLLQGAYARLSVSGPSDLIASLDAHLGDARGAMSFAETDGVDLVVTADDTVLETRIGAWIRSLDTDLVTIVTESQSSAEHQQRDADPCGMAGGAP